MKHAKQALLGTSIGLVLTLIVLSPTLVAPNYQGEQTATLVMLPQLSMGEAGDLYSLQVYQWTGSSWVFRGAVGDTGGTITLVAAQPVHFDVVVRYVYAYDPLDTCPSSMSLNRVYIAITGEVTSIEMTKDSCPTTTANYRYILFTYDWDVAGKPVAGATYAMSLSYDSYF